MESDRERALLAEMSDSFGRLERAAALRAGEELCVCDLAWISERSQNLVPHHLRALRRAELVTARREGKMVMYRLTETGTCLLEVVLAPLVEVSR